MAIEMLTYADMAERLKISPEAARALVKRHRLPRSRANDGKTLVSVDLTEIQHTRLPARSSGGDRASAAALKIKVGELQEQITKLEAVAGGHRADFERERERAEQLMAELLNATADMMAATEAAVRLEGELAALRSRSWWQRLVG